MTRPGRSTTPPLNVYTPGRGRAMQQHLDAQAGRVASPMEQEYPAICEWVRHQTVSTYRLREELQRALAWINECNCGLRHRTGTCDGGR